MASSSACALSRKFSMRAPLNMLGAPSPAGAPSGAGPAEASEAVLDGCVRASYATTRDPLLHWGPAAPPRIFLFVKKWDEPSSLAASLALGRWLAGLGRVVLAGADEGDGAPLPRAEFARLGPQADGSVLSQGDVDLVIVVGGDGSVMHASALFGEACPPVLALSTGGSLGFLTAHSLASARALLCRVMHLPPEACEAARVAVAAAEAAALAAAAAGDEGSSSSSSSSSSSGSSSNSSSSSSSSGSGSSSAGPTRAGSPLCSDRTAPPSCAGSGGGAGGGTVAAAPPQPAPPALPPQPQPQPQRSRGCSGGGQREEEELLPPLPHRAPGTAGVSMRMRLQVEVYSGGVARSVHVVLNELHLGRGASPVMTRIAAYVDDEPLTTVLSDGLIISTQTGSTAYALSAGGSILSPATRGIMFCPICPHTLSFRPLVLSDAAVLRLEVDEASRGACQATFDGRPESIPLRRGDYVLVRASPWPLPLLVHRGPTTDWLLGLHQKLLWNVRGDGFKSRLPAQRSAGAARGGGSGGSLEGASEEA